MKLPPWSWRVMSLSALFGLAWTWFEIFSFMTDNQWRRLQHMLQSVGGSLPASVVFTLDLHNYIRNNATGAVVILVLSLIAVGLLELAGRWRLIVQTLLLAGSVTLMLLGFAMGRSVFATFETYRPQNAQGRYAGALLFPKHRGSRVSYDANIIHRPLQILYGRIYSYPKPPKQFRWVEVLYDELSTDQKGGRKAELRLAGALHIYLRLKDYLANKPQERKQFSFKLTSTLPFDSKEEKFTAYWQREWVYQAVFRRLQKLLPPAPALPPFEGSVKHAKLSKQGKTPITALIRTQHQEFYVSSAGKSFALYPRDDTVQALVGKKDAFAAATLVQVSGTYIPGFSSLTSAKGLVTCSSMLPLKLKAKLAPLVLSTFGTQGLGSDKSKKQLTFLRSREVPRATRPQPKASHIPRKEQVAALGFSYDARHALWVTASGKVVAWDVTKDPKTARLIGVFPGKALALRATRGPKARVWIAGAFPEILGYALDGKGPPHKLTGHKGIVRALATFTDGRLLASADSEGSVRVWLGQKPIHTFSLKAPVTALSFSSHPKARLIAGLQNGQIVYLR